MLTAHEGILFPSYLVVLIPLFSFYLVVLLPLFSYDLVVLTAQDGILSSLTVYGGGRLSLFIIRTYPSPIASRNVRGLQVSSWSEIAHASVSCTSCHGLIVHSTKQPGAGKDGVFELLRANPDNSYQIPPDGVFVLQGGEITKTADE